MKTEFSKVISDALTSAYLSGFKAGMDFLTVGKGVNHDAQRPKRKYKPRKKKAVKKALPK